MSDNNLDLRAMRGKTGLARAVSPGERRGAPPDPALEDEEECPAFGYLRGIRDRALSIEFRLAGGNSAAFPYSWLGPVQYNPSHGLLLKFTGDLVYLVLIEGSNLNAVANGVVSLYERGIQWHRITFVREMTRQQVEKAGEGEVTVERIRTLSYRPDDEPKDVEWLEPFRDRS